MGQVEHPGLPSPSEADHVALDELEDAALGSDEQRTALEAVRPYLRSLSQALGDSLLTVLRGVHQREGTALCGESIDALEHALSEDPMKLLAYSTGRSLVGEALGSDPEGPLSELLAELGGEEHDAQLAETLDDMSARAYAPETCTPTLKYFRVGLVQGFHPQVRASALAALDPARYELALALVVRYEEPEALIDAFDQSRAETDIEAAKMSPGPPRHFSWVHAVFAFIIAGLTAYHYLFR